MTINSKDINFISYLITDCPADKIDCKLWVYVWENPSQNLDTQFRIRWPRRLHLVIFSPLD